MAKKYQMFLFFGLALLLFDIFLGLSWGRYPISLQEVFYGFTNPSMLSDEVIEVVLLEIRLPRVIMAIVVGAGLSVAGATLQSIFGNPLVSEHILGVSSGAGFGAAVGIVWLGSSLGIQISAVIFGLIAMAFSYLLSNKYGKINTLMLVLAGIVVNALFSSGISMLQYFADSDKELPAITFWLMGGMTSVTMESVIRTVPIILSCILALYMVRWQLNIISLDEEEATSMGLNVKQFRLMAILLSTIITAVSVAVCGMISFIGIIVPHFTRLLIGNDNKYVIPASAICGSIFLLLVDNFARNLNASEIPLSILTSIIGAPVFAYMLRKTGGVFSD